MAEEALTNLCAAKPSLHAFQRTNLGGGQREGEGEGEGGEGEGGGKGQRERTRTQCVLSNRDVGVLERVVGRCVMGMRRREEPEGALGAMRVLGRLSGQWAGAEEEEEEEEGMEEKEEEEEEEGG
eukprot:1579436-Rhodomonas_salina.2